MSILPGLLLALVLAFAGQFLSDFIGIDLMGLPKSPISAIMMAILLGILIRNLFKLPEFLQPGIRFGLVRVLRVLELLPQLDTAFPETGPRPMDLLKLKGKERKRVSRRGIRERDSDWSWGDDE